MSLVKKNGHPPTPIDKNWGEIEKIEEKAKIKSGDHKAGFAPRYLYFSGVKNLVIPVTYRKKNFDGSFSARTSEFYAIAKFCPFTGRPLYKQSEK